MTTNNNQTGWIFRDELIRLSPVEFAEFVEQLSKRLWREPNDKTERVFPFHVFKLNDFEAKVEICPYKDEFEDEDSRPYAIMTATHHPDGYSKVTLEADPVNFAGVKEYWEYLLDALKVERLIMDAPRPDDIKLSAKAERLLKKYQDARNMIELVKQRPEILQAIEFDRMLPDNESPAPTVDAAKDKAGAKTRKEKAQTDFDKTKNDETKKRYRAIGKVYKTMCNERDKEYKSSGYYYNVNDELLRDRLQELITDKKLTMKLPKPRTLNKIIAMCDEGVIK
jgi:hypothetical protein